jgi:epoxyqueuosine reductase
MTLRDAVENEAQALGFAAFGVASADYDPAGHSRHLRWLDKGYHGSMKYLERGPRQRFDPRVHLPDAQSVIVCAHNYYSRTANDAARPYVSVYARGENYHTVLGDKFGILCDKMRALAPQYSSLRPGQSCVRTKIFVDASPISEKVFAVKAGIGFMGRNGMVIIPKRKNGRKNETFGSFFFLGLVITNLKMEPDSPGIGTCGQCRKCIDACPTDAIVGDGIIDATRCISYHTTQNKGDIPEEFASAMGNMIFGCDICQQVCPYNNGVSPSEEPRFLPDPGMAAPDLTRLIDISEAEFERRFANNCIGEFSYGMFKRNVAIANENINNVRRNTNSKKKD